MIYIIDLIPQAVAKNLSDFYDFCQFEDGSVSGSANRLEKHTERICDEVHYPTMSGMLNKTVATNDLLQYVYMPKMSSSPQFVRYAENMHYSWHYDKWIIDGMRTDYSVTLFLNDPSEYDGGELEILVGNSGSTTYKLKPGQAVIYSTGLHHRVKPVTRGERRVACWWMNSLIDDPTHRELLVDLSECIINVETDHKMRGRLENLRAKYIRANATL